MKGYEKMRFSKNQIRAICWVIAGAMLLTITASIIGILLSI